MEINIHHLTHNIERFHKTTRLLAAKASGVHEDRLNAYPVIIEEGGKLGMILVGKRGNGDYDFVTPYVVNGSFSLELCLKLLRFRDKGNWARGHNLKNLFDGLSDTSKELMDQHFKELVKDSARHIKIAEILNIEKKVPFAWDLAKLIDQSGNAFDNWRYAYEHKKVGCFAGYDEIRTVLLRRATDLEKKTG